jgi:hypothetical protein
VDAVTCPKCGRTDGIRPKLLLIDKFNHAHFREHPEERSGCLCQSDLSVDGLKPEFVADSPLEQFVEGHYCQACGIGFVSDDVAKSLPQMWKLSPQGWHRVQTDGSLGPPEAPPGMLKGDGGVA